MKNINSSQLKVKSRRLTRAERAEFILPAGLKDILVGLMLGDLYVQKQTKSVNVRLLFAQSTVHKDYLYHLYELFSIYCSTGPKVFNQLPHKRTGNVYSLLKFQTFALPCFNELYYLFYPEGKKLIPKNIWDLLTPLSLAY